MIVKNDISNHDICILKHLLSTYFKDSYGYNYIMNDIDKVIYSRVINNINSKGG